MCMTPQVQSSGETGEAFSMEGQSPEFRSFLNKLRVAKGLSYESLARKMGTPDDIIEQRVKQLKHFFLDEGEPRASFALAINKALGVTLEAEDYGWDPERP